MKFDFMKVYARYLFFSYSIGGLVIWSVNWEANLGELSEIGHASRIWLMLIKLGIPDTYSHTPQILGFPLTHKTTVLAAMNKSCACVDFVWAATVIYSNIVYLCAHYSLDDVFYNSLKITYVAF